MKEILSHQLDSVAAAWADADGSGHHSATNGGSRSGETSTGGNSGNYSLQSFLSQNSPYGSGSSASGIWGGLSAMRPPVTAIVETAPMVTMQTLAMLAIIISP